MLNLLQMAILRDLPAGPLPTAMSQSDATALRLVKQEAFGADLIRFPPGGRVPDHTHVGDHILYVLSGRGWVDYDGQPWPLEAGTLYLIPSMVRHGIRAETELTLLAVANVHRDAASEDRLYVTPLAPAYPGRSGTVGRTGGGRSDSWRPLDEDGQD